MKTLALITLLLPSLALADGELGKVGKDGCYTKIIKVCPTKKKKPAPVVVVPPPEPPAAAPAPEPVPCTPTVITLYKPVYRTVYKTKYVKVLPPPCEELPVLFGPRVALGLGLRDPYVSGLLGVRLEIPKAYLGLDVYSQLQYGVGIQALIFAYRGPIVKVHVLDPGVFVTGDPFKYISAPDVPRRLDMVLGAGLSVKVHCNVELTADWRVNIPDPKLLNEKNGVCDGINCGQALDSRAVVGNAFAQSQLLLGVYFHD